MRHPDIFALERLVDEIEEPLPELRDRDIHNLRL
jgi:hypothetical protein